MTREAANLMHYLLVLCFKKYFVEGKVEIYFILCVLHTCAILNTCTYLERWCRLLMSQMYGA